MANKSQCFINYRRIFINFTEYKKVFREYICTDLNLLIFKGEKEIINIFAPD